MFRITTRRVARGGVITVGLVLLGISSGALAQEQTPAAASDLPMPPQVAVSPSKFEVQVGSRATVEALRVFNFGEQAVDVEATVAPWTLDERNEVLVVEPTEQSLDQWIVLNPVRFTIAARSSQTVRFAVRPRIRPEPGEHRAMIYLNQVPDPQSAARMQVNFQVGVAVYGYVGDVERHGDLNGVEVVSDAEILAARFDISSQGSAHVRMHGHYAIWPEAGFTGVDQIAQMGDPDLPETVLPDPILRAGSLPSTPVLPGTRRSLTLAFRHGLPSGRYVIGFLGTLGDADLRASQGFFVPPRPGSVIAAEQQRQQQQH